MIHISCLRTWNDMDTCGFFAPLPVLMGAYIPSWPIWFNNIIQLWVYQQEIPFWHGDVGKLRITGHFSALVAYYCDVIMSAMASQITSVSIVYSTVCPDADKKISSKVRATGPCEGNSPVTVNPGGGGGVLEFITGG